MNYCFYLLGGELSIERLERKRRKRKRIEMRGRERKGKGERRVELCLEALFKCIEGSNLRNVLS